MVRARAWAAAGFLVAVTVWLRAPTWNDRILFIDEAIGVTYGQRLQLPGASVYTHTPDMKPPLGPMTYLAAVTLSPEHAIAVVHVFTTVTLGVTALLLLYAAVHFACSITAGVVAGLLYLLATEMFVLDAEPLFAFSSYDHFMAPWLVGSACLFLVALERERAAPAVLAGTALGVAALYKQNAPVMGAALAVVALVAAAQGRLRGRRAAVLVIATGLACAAVVVSAPLYYAARGQFADWWFFNVEALRRYSQLGDHPTFAARAEALRASLPMPALAACAFAYGLLGTLRRERTSWSGPWTVLAALCGAALFVSLVPGLAKVHYVLQVLPFECSLIGLMPVELLRSSRAAAGARRVVVGAGALVLAVAVGVAAVDLFRWRERLLQFIAADDYLKHHRLAGTLDPVLRYVRTHTAPEDLIYVQGTAPEFYFLTQRRPAARDAFQGWFVGPWTLEAGAQLLRELQATPPHLIIQLGYQPYTEAWYLDGLPGFCSWLHANYRERVVTDLAQVLERIDPSEERPPSGRYVALGRLPVAECAQPEWRRVDRSAAGGPLSVQGAVYKHGLGVRAPSSLTYTVPLGYEVFTAVVGVDDQSAEGDAVIFRVAVDDALRFEHLVHRGDPPTPVSVEIAPGAALRLIADPESKESERPNYADWLDARLSRPRP
jgi:hypothetical protein